MTASDRPPDCRVCSRRSVLLGAGAAVGVLATGCAAGQAETAPVRIPLSDIPVGGGVVLSRERVVVTQPVAGTFRAFSAVCPHQGCLVGAVRDGVIECSCHGSRFGLDDGSVRRGPSREPLAARAVVVDPAGVEVR